MLKPLRKYATDWGRNRTVLQRIAAVNKPATNQIHQRLPPDRNAGTFALHSTRRNYSAGFSSSSFLKENMTNYKEYCTKYLSNRLRGSSDWRRAQGTKFNDARNDKASQRLLELESSIEIPDAIWNDIAPYYNENDSRWLAAVSDTNRDIGFRRHPRDFSTSLATPAILVIVVILLTESNRSNRNNRGCYREGCPLPGGSNSVSIASKNPAAILANDVSDNKVVHK
jgi:hypothetical protein